MSGVDASVRKSRPGSRMTSLAALLFLFGCAIGVQYAAPFASGLSDVVKAAVRAPSALNFLLGGAAFAAWLGVAATMGMALFGVCLLVEIVLDGPPRSWGVTLNATAMQGVGLGYAILINPFVVRLMPDAWGFPALLRITETDLPGWFAPAAPVALTVFSLFVYNLAQYGAHRAQHAIPWLWRFHAVHHSVRDMDSMNSFTHPVDSIGAEIARSTLLVFVVVDFQMVMWIGGLMAIHDRLLHTRAQVNFGVFKDVLIDNRHHFVHHSTDPRDFDKNFSAWFTFWDRAFGTYSSPMDISLVTTGLDDRKPPQTIWQFVSGRLEPDAAPVGGPPPLLAPGSGPASPSGQDVAGR